MIKIRYCLLLAVLCFSPVALSAAENNPQSLQELIVLGLKANLGLKIELTNVAQSRESIVIEGAEFDSQILASTSFAQTKTPFETTLSTVTENRTKQYAGQLGVSQRFRSGLTSTLSVNSQWESDNDTSNDLDPRYRTAILVDLNQPLLRDLGAEVNTTNLDISRNQQRQASLAFLLQAQNLTYQLETIVRQIAGEGQIIEMRKEAESLANELYQANKKRYEAGVIPISELQEAETAQANRQLDLSLSSQAYDLLVETLNQQLNFVLGDNFAPSGLMDNKLPDEEADFSDISALLERALQKRLELKIVEYTLDNSSLRKRYQLNQLKPQLDLKLQAGLNGLSGRDRGITVGSSYDNSWLDSFASLSGADGYQWGVGLQFSMPLGNRAAKSRLYQTELQVKQEQYRRHDLEAAIKNELLQQQTNIKRTKEQLEIAQRFAALALKSLEQEQRRLDEGLSDTFRMIAFQDKMISAKIGQVNALTRYHIALAQMDFALGNIFERHGIILTENAEELNLENI
jgi:outer membrane protein TolC